MDDTIFFNHVRKHPFGGELSGSQVEGIDVILGAWDKIYPKADLRFKAYSLATTFRETAQTMQPIEEIGHGRGHAYGIPTGPWHRIYDGRGDVQLTWIANYKKATARLRALKFIGDDVDLVKDPDLAKRPDIAAAVMVIGMSEGWFTGRKLADYFTSSHSDPVNARRIINSLDCANIIAGYYSAFLDALKASQGSVQAA